MSLSVVDDYDAIAAHEAGHAVVAAVTGQRFEYVTMRPRRAEAAAHVVFRNQNQLRGHWEAHTAISFAGIIAEDLYILDEVLGFQAFGSQEHEKARRFLVRDHGRQDMYNARTLTRWAWAIHCRGGHHNTWSAPGVEDDWSPVDLAVCAWQRAARLVGDYIEAIAELASELVDSPRALTWAQVTEIVAEVGPTEHDEEMPAELLHPWFLDYTRLTWMPSEVWIAREELAAACIRGGGP